MPFWGKRQQSPRVSIQLPLRHTLLASPLARTGTGWTRNLSEGGACIELPEALAAGSRLRLQVQTEQGEIAAVAAVVWAAASPDEGSRMCHGVLFTRITRSQRQLLRVLLQAHKTRHNGARLSADLPMSYWTRDHPRSVRSGRIENVSWGGLLLSLPERRPPGTRLEITWQLAGEQLTVQGTIVWVEPRKLRAAIRHGFHYPSISATQ